MLVLIFFYELFLFKLKVGDEVINVAANNKNNNN